MTTMSPDVARRRFVLITALTWLPQGFGLAAGVLLMTVRGLDLPTIGLVFVVHSLLATGLELPTGGLADVVGRRGVLVASTVIGTLSFAWMAFAATACEFLVIAALRGIARALSTGPAEAWYVDVVHAADPHASIRTGLARGATAGSIALGAGALLGGGVPLVLPLVWSWSDDSVLPPLAVPMLLAALAFAASLVVTVTKLVEPPRTTVRPKLRDVLRGVPTTVLGGLKLGFGDRSLALLFGTVIANGIALSAVELLTPARFAELTGGATTAGMGYALVATVGFVASGFGSALSPRLTGLLGSTKRTVVVSTIVAAGSLTALASTGGLAGTVGIIAVGGGYAGMFFGLGLLAPARSEIMHGRVTGELRATMVSVQSLTLQGGAVLGSLGLAWLAEAWSIPGAWLVGGAVFLCSTVLIFGVVRPSPLAEPTRAQAASQGSS